jgi:non-specific serine/threonine protein kinase/serine/threonine-protein kinase
MGAVYRATQQSPHRIVALKLMKPGLVSPRALRRFELESEVLGRLTHPGIAQIHEAGMHDGAPFFAMEYVPGPTLTEYAESNNLGTRDRLALFAKVCDAVHHAHAKGIIHRDLKPHNILVAQVGEPPKPQPKILDFGVARATDSDTQSATMRTDVGQLVGTIPYMSPEQVAADPGDIDTRSDVYALGVVLYELLAGRLPYDLQRKMIHEAARAIREDEPTRLSSINTTLRGDVETIVAKALEKERERRYQSALDFASDIRRYLTDQPISARPPSTWYQFRKFSKRNKALVTGTAAAFAALLLGLAGTTYGLIQANTQRQRVEHANTALRAQNDNARTAIEELLVVSGVFDQYDLAPGQSTSAYIESPSGDTAPHYFTLRADDEGAITIDPGPSGSDNPRTSADFAAALPALAVEYTRSALERERARIDELEQVSQFQQRQLEQISPNAMGVGIRESIISNAQERDRLLRFSEVQIESRSTELAGALEGVDFTGTALKAVNENILVPSIQQINADFAQQPIIRARLLQSIAALMRSLGLLEEAAPAQHTALELRQNELGPDHPDTLDSEYQSAFLDEVSGNVEQAEQRYRYTYEAQRRILGRMDLSTARTAAALGRLLLDLGKPESAEPFIYESIEVRTELLGLEDTSTLDALSHKPKLLLALGRAEEATQAAIEHYELCKAVLDPENPTRYTSLAALGYFQYINADLDNAIQSMREALQGTVQHVGIEHPASLQQMINLGSVTIQAGRPDEAEGYLKQCVDISNRKYGRYHARTAQAVEALAYAIDRQGRLEESLPYFEQAHEALEYTFGPQHPDTLNSAFNLSTLYYQVGDYERAEQYARSAVDGYQNAQGDRSVPLIRSIESLATALAKQERFIESATLLEENEPNARAVLVGSQRRWLGSYLIKIGYVTIETEEFDKANAALVEALQLVSDGYGPSSPYTQRTLELLIDLHTRRHQSDPTANHDTKAADYQAQLDQILAEQASGEQPDP